MLQLIMLSELTEPKIIDEFPSFDEVNLFLETIQEDEADELFNAELIVRDTFTGIEYYETDFLEWTMVPEEYNNW